LPGQGTYLPYGKSSVFRTHRKYGLFQKNPALLFFMISDQPEIGKKISIALLWIQLAGIPGQPVSKPSFSCRELSCRNFPGRFLRNQNLKSTQSLVYGENGRGGGEILQIGNSMRGRGVFQQMPPPRGWNEYYETIVLVTFYESINSGGRRSARIFKRREFDALIRRRPSGEYRSPGYLKILDSSFYENGRNSPCNIFYETIK
jgi:hypothetical protein